ncbi:efflux RND transporter periplasmic adaptor subunit [Pseudothioclava arenosa]|uniref:Efflux transporter periplasmic adaptor subunit n=1 Tax=Pseudothioclava arenosa TaxID=1795308 RepID=A0A2A4CMN4_9RHOB|nr:efflux RND transporter periplasmic adaptor subunit [Pseudothioclava arenosa]PCD77243.1 efflux transporter periplasmic adaptor subunit [Pseudothioclava arenosa]
MKIVPIVNAVLVTSALYLLVFERERLMGFAGQEQAEAAPEAAQASAGAVDVQVLHAVAAAVDQGVLTRGQTEAARRVEMRAETSARVISEPLRKGASVAAGDILCELDPGSRLAALAQAEAALAEAELSANAATKLQQGGYRSDTAAAGAQAALKAATAALDAAQQELAHANITAPFAGILEDDSAELGALLSSGGLCATVIALDPIKLVGFVPETELGRVAPGARVGARLTTGQEVLGRLTFVARSADSATRTFRVEAELPNPDLSIREGQTLEMLIAAEGTKGHFLPASALTLDDDGRLGVRLAVEGITRFAPVTLLRDTREGVWVAGLPETAEVIVVGQDYVTEGAAVIAHPATDVPGFGGAAQ